ncbi:hypothetical protein SEA_WOLLYPOG_55 [Arthrobacter phage Wollypog]|uniref:Uncharacterized protein n=1 Tax=Arthrobacter phage Wollypog TaxID=2790985 RepID=A0A7T3KC97_9CAUD|nr:hypothetical protein PP291_gp55 [Arthrobacter phage Wollypog]QPX62607.1 hypothetical protein SEA_WOLLYPOG_55 [Arthrobacter phage Wollypog]
MPDLTDTYANSNGEFVFKTDETTPQQVIKALDDLATFMDLFETRSREYGDGAAFFLGSKGQFSDIYRKIIKLKTALWDGKPEQLTSEGVEEVIYDLIGHLLLTLQCLRLEGFHPLPLRGEEKDVEAGMAVCQGPQVGDWPFSLPNDDRVYKFDSGDRVRNTDTVGWLAGATGVVIKQDRQSAGVWYKVDFGPQAGEITCSDKNLELVQ